MSEKKTFNVSGTVSIQLGKIVSVEKGNVEKPIDIASKVCAFSMEVEGSAFPVKVILKGATAEKIYADELRNGKSSSSAGNETRVNITAEIREIREKEFVIHNPVTIEFYKVTAYKMP
jgi:hypothetical protein